MTHGFVTPFIHPRCRGKWVGRTIKPLKNILSELSNTNTIHIGDFQGEYQGNGVPVFPYILIFNVPSHVFSFLKVSNVKYLLNVLKGFRVLYHSYH